ncbi:MAG: hypothetical protein HRT99_03870 [Mycoplasmatales bacterium]|nr:hypothetical protein [Mycoplasmatales bacterium]
MKKTINEIYKIVPKIKNIYLFSLIKVEIVRLILDFSVTLLLLPISFATNNQNIWFLDRSLIILYLLILSAIHLFIIWFRIITKISPWHKNYKKILLPLYKENEKKLILKNLANFGILSYGEINFDKPTFGDAVALINSVRFKGFWWFWFWIPYIFSIYFNMTVKFPEQYRDELEEKNINDEKANLKSLENEHKIKKDDFTNEILDSEIDKIYNAIPKIKNIYLNGQWKVTIFRLLAELWAPVLFYILAGNISSWESNRSTIRFWMIAWMIISIAINIIPLIVNIWAIHIPWKKRYNELLLPLYKLKQKKMIMKIMYDSGLLFEYDVDFNRLKFTYSYNIITGYLPEYSLLSMISPLPDILLFVFMIFLRKKIKKYSPKYKTHVTNLSLIPKYRKEALEIIEKSNIS